MVNKWIFDRLKGDKMIWMVIFFISLISMLAVYSSTSTLAFKLKGGNTEYYLFKHAILLGFGFIVMYLTHLFDYRIFAKIGNILLYLTVPLLIYTLLFGQNINEASRWVTVFGQSFQPSDLAKLSLIIYLAKALTRKQEMLDDFHEGFLYLVGVVLLVCAFIAPADLSTASVIFATALVLMFIGGVKLKYIGGLILAGALVLFVLVSTVPRAETWKTRFSDYIERYSDENYEPNYQTVQANMAIAGGGLFGKGVGKSTQKNYLPQPYSDFVFAIILEEFGLFGGLITIGLYLLLLFRSVAIVTISKTFGALLAAGLSLTIVLQALINMAVAVGLLPVTGLTLPMLSMGGTSIVFTGVSLGIILSVSRYAIEQKELNETT